MKLEIKLIASKEPIYYIGDKIEILDFNMNNIEYKQIRVFKKGFSKSELIAKNLIKSTKISDN